MKLSWKYLLILTLCATTSNVVLALETIDYGLESKFQDTWNNQHRRGRTQGRKRQQADDRPGPPRLGSKSWGMSSKEA